jgi:hypothetical protein
MEGWNDSTRRPAESHHCSRASTLRARAGRADGEARWSLVRIRALTTYARQNGHGVLQPGEDGEEHDFHAMATVSDRLVVPVDPEGDGVRAAQHRPAKSRVVIGRALGGGVPAPRERPVSASEGARSGLLGDTLSDDPFRGWDGLRGPLEQAGND